LKSTQKVQLVTFTPNPDTVASIAARMCYSSGGIDSLLEHDNITAVLPKVLASGHLSVLRHVMFTFAVEGISRACSHQLVRHSVGVGISQQSQRYVKSDSPTYIVPPTIENFGSKGLSRFFDTSIRHSWEQYKEVMAAGIPAEDARFLLPNAAETKMLISFTGEALLHLFEKRDCIRSQWEIKSIVNLMMPLVKSVAPIMFDKAGALCKTAGYCPEGGMSCGRAPTMEILVESYQVLRPGKP
jgi:thymidylate synthase (FAD)